MQRAIRDKLFPAKTSARWTGGELRALAAVVSLFVIGAACEDEPCGDPAVIDRFAACILADDEQSCLQSGGRWDRGVFGDELYCFCPTGQEGCSCRRQQDCLGVCSAPLTKTPSWNCEGAASGTCSAEAHLNGCHCVFDEDGNADVLCSN